MNKEIPVACCHSIFTKEQRVEYRSIWGELGTRMLGITELENGYPAAVLLIAYRRTRKIPKYADPILSKTAIVASAVVDHPVNP